MPFFLLLSSHQNYPFGIPSRVFILRTLRYSSLMSLGTHRSSTTTSSPGTHRTFRLDFHSRENDPILTASAFLLLHLALATKLCKNHLCVAADVGVGVVEAHLKGGSRIFLGGQIGESPASKEQRLLVELGIVVEESSRNDRGRVGD